ncbi:hypothetical protein [Mucilaginibacter defluvii]|uniref:Uncharacterized protein n=1 Tax=Mucilaginibacter defluvii TaxID=1196019 RepID=A0ABP9G686_9SPHI
MKRASVYVFKTYYLVHSQSTTTTGFGVASEPYIKMDKDVAMEELANKVIIAMNCSKVNVAESTDHSMESFLKAIDLKRHEDLYLQSIHCMIYEKDNKFIFIPSINGGIKGGFRYLPKQKIEISSGATIDVISDALEKTLSLCE